jgi:hypothetical protein
MSTGCRRDWRSGNNESDGDYHLVFTDDTLNYGDEGANPPIPPTGHSFIGEVPDPHCFSGADGTNMSDSSNVRSSSRKRNVFEGKWQFNQSNFQDERNPAIDYAKFRQPIT